MTIACMGPDPEPGIALRLSGYLDCQARALGENGFQALAGGPVAAGLLSGLVTIFVALIGYRLILGAMPAVRDGVTWAVRLGVVLALATGWPAFQTLVHGVVVDGPGQLAATILPAAGLPSEAPDSRVQQAYDTIRLGSAAGAPADGAPAQDDVAPGHSTAPTSTQRSPLAQPPLPQTASVLVLTTTGVTAALRLATGLLLAVAPLAILALLFDATLGVFSGWVRAVVGTALGVLAATIVTAIELVMVESELARLQSYAVGGIAGAVDPQALTTIVLVFALVMAVGVIAAMRMAGAFRMPPLGSPFFAERDGGSPLPATQAHSGRAAPASAPSGGVGRTPPSRVAAVADALALTVRREQGLAAAVAGGDAHPSRASVVHVGGRDAPAAPRVPLGVAGRRSTGRRSPGTERRDRTA